LTAKDAAALLKRCRATLAGAGSYRAEFALLDRSVPELASFEHTSMHWTMNHAGNDREHVVQRGWDPAGHTFLYDEWFDIGSRHIDMAPLPISVEGESTELRRKITQYLRIDRLLAVLSSSRHSSVEAQTLIGSRHLVYNYEIEISSPLLAGPLARYASLVAGPYQLRVWVNAQTACVSRYTVTGATMQNGNAPATLEIAHSFGLWNAPINVSPPEAPLATPR
jgi:hypothetical protein